MNIFLALVGLPLVLILPGLSTVAALAPKRRLDWLERIYLVLAISLVLSGWLGLILAQAGCFSAGLLLGLLALYSLVLGFVAWRRGVWRWPRPDGPKELTWVILAFLALTVLFGLLAFRPFELILGPRDAAVYPATGAYIAQHGSIRIHDPLILSLTRPTEEETHLLWINFFSLQHPGRYYYHYLRMPGFFIANTEQGVTIPQFIPAAAGSTVVPQFYHLYPTWLAIAFSLIGVKAGLLMTPYLSFLGGIGVFLVARRLFGARVALLAYLFLGLNALQVWFARYSTAEGATQFLIFLGLYGLLRLDDGETADQEPFFGLLTGVALGMIGLVRAEFFFPWLLLLPYLAYLFVARRFRRGHYFMLASGGVFVLHTIAQFVTHTRGYTLGIYYHRIQDWYSLSWLVYPFITPTLQEYFFLGDTPRTLVMHQPWRLAYELGIPFLLVGLLIVLRRSPALAARIGEWLRRHRRLLLGLAAGFFFLWAAYSYLIRPGLLTGEVLRNPIQNWPTLEGYIGAPIPEGSAGNVVRLGWYLSPLGIALAVAGVTGLLLREASRRSWYLLLLGPFYLFLFTYEVFGMDHHVYIMRRYIPVVVPFLCLAMAYALLWLAQARRLRWVARFVSGGLALLMVFYLAYTGLPFFQHDEYRGALDQVEALAERFGPDDILLLVDVGRDTPFTIATPLQYIFDRNAFGVVAAQPDGTRIEDQIRRWQADGHQVYLLLGNDGGRLFLPHTRPRWLDRFELAVPEFEQLKTQKPHNAYVLEQPFGIYALEPWDGSGSPLGPLPVKVDLGSADYVYQVSGFYRDERANDGTSYCWTSNTGTLRLPWPEGDETVTITMRLAGGRRPAELGPAEVEARLGGRSVDSWFLEEGFTTHELVLRAREVPAEASGTVLLTLVSPVWKQVDYGLGGDTRPLGVQVDWVQVEMAPRR